MSRYVNADELIATCNIKWWTFYHYCPNCGALMVNEDEEMSKVSEMEVAYAEYLND